MSFLRRPSDPPSIPSVFPTFLHSSLPLRRKSRQLSTDSTTSTTSSVFSHASGTTVATQYSSNSISTNSPSSNPFSRCPTPTPIPTSSTAFDVSEPTDKLLVGHSSHLCCAKCSTHLALTAQIISKGFTGRHGRAYLVHGTSDARTHSQIASSSTLPNTYLSKAVPRHLVTGPHTVSDVSCAICGSLLGWKYVGAGEESQKYKVGKFILETRRIRVSVSWEEESEEGMNDANDRYYGRGKSKSKGKSNHVRSDGLLGTEVWTDTWSINNSTLHIDGGGGSGSGIAKDSTTKRDRTEVMAVGPSLSTPLIRSISTRVVPDDEFDSQDEDECEDLFAGVWSPALAARRRTRKRERERKGNGAAAAAAHGVVNKVTKGKSSMSSQESLALG